MSNYFEPVWICKPQIAAEKTMKLYSEQNLQNNLRTFSWNINKYETKIDFKSHIERRKNLEFSGEPKLSAEEIVGKFNQIHKWGFKNQNIPSKDIDQRSFSICCQNLYDTWLNLSEGNYSALNSFKDMLFHKNIKIARISKFTAMLAPEFGAIYDSRVSLALRGIEFENKRVFPTIGRKQTKRKKYPHQDSIVSNKDKISHFYLWYLEVLTYIRKHYRTFKTNSEIEMALFMIGK